MTALGNSGSEKVTSVELAGGAGNWRNTSIDSPALSVEKPVVVNGRPSVSRRT